MAHERPSSTRVRVFTATNPSRLAAIIVSAGRVSPENLHRQLRIIVDRV